MLVRSAVRNDSTSCSEHNAYLASLLIVPDDGGLEVAQPAKPAGSGGAAAPPRGTDSSCVPPAVTRTSSRKRAKVVAGPRLHDREMVENLEAEIAALVLQIRGIQRDVEKVQESIATGSAHGGRQGLPWKRWSRT